MDVFEFMSALHLLVDRPIWRMSLYAANVRVRTLRDQSMNAKNYFSLKLFRT